MEIVIRRIMLATAIMAFAWHVTLLIRYLMFPAYFDHGEAFVLIQSWWLLHGAKLYTSPWSPDYMIAPYGPVAYGANALMMWALGGSVLTSKLGGELASLTAVILLALSAYRRFGLEIAAWVTLACESYLLAQVPVSFLPRPESWALLLSSLGLFLTTRPGRKTACLLGLCGGLLLGTKFHFSLALLPSVASLLMSQQDRKARAIAILLGGIAGAALPWLMVGGSVENYWNTLHIMAVNRKFLAAPPFMGLACLGVLAAPPLLVLALAYAQGHRPAKADLCYIGLLVIVLALTTVLVSMEGIFWNHFIPFIPASAEGLGRMLPSLSPGRPRRLLLALVFSLFLFWPIPPQVEFWTDLARQSPLLERGAAQIERTLIRFPGRTVELGLGSGDQWSDSYALALWQPLLAFRGHPVTLPSSLDMESVYLGLPMPKTRMAGLSDCRSLWLVPHDETPFSLTSLYHRPMVWPEAQALFLKDKIRIEQGEPFDLWACREAAATVPQ